MKASVPRNTLAVEQLAVNSARFREVMSGGLGCPSRHCGVRDQRAGPRTPLRRGIGEEARAQQTLCNLRTFRNVMTTSPDSRLLTAWGRIWRLAWAFRLGQASTTSAET